MAKILKKWQKFFKKIASYHWSSYFRPLSGHLIARFSKKGHFRPIRFLCHRTTPFHRRAQTGSAIAGDTVSRWGSARTRCRCLILCVSERVFGCEKSSKYYIYIGNIEMGCSRKSMQRTTMEERYKINLNNANYSKSAY